MVCVFANLKTEIFQFLVLWKPLNVITLGQTESENINPMITISVMLLIQRAE
jgi:hypothetical protein